MSGFQERIAQDARNVFLNPEEFARICTIRYDGEIYPDIPVVLSGRKESQRRQLAADHAQGLYLVSQVLHCAREDLGGHQPEKGQRLAISDRADGFFHWYYVADSLCEMGMLRVELEAMDE